MLKHFSAPWQLRIPMLVFLFALAFSLQAQDKVDTPPKPVNMASVYQAIGYPKAAAKANKEAKVLVKILIGKDGKYVKHEYLGNPESVFTDAIDAHIADIEFTAAQKEGKAVKYWVTLPFMFKLKQD
ncbi:MAG: energy transducer TonB [Bacteroidota bacterium]